MKDIEIARSIKKKDIKEVAKKIGISEDDLILYGNDKAKIKSVRENKDGKLVLVTAISPTPYGEGKTTVSIGLTDALNILNKNVVGVLREPSMGPVFGMKGGATGGGYSQVVPMEDINLHFTGDFHAITAANNLLCAAIDNHIYFGNKLDINRVTFGRCLDVNDRSLRSVVAGGRTDVFAITAASEIMALFCLAKDLNDLKEKLGNIVIGYNSNDDEIYAKDLKVEGSMTALLKDAFLPNLVQTLEGNPVIIHGGPFANIAHGCNSIIATKLALKLSDYVITEAGFGADLGAEKFLDIKCRVADIKPDAIVLVATLKALKYHGGVAIEEVKEENVDGLDRGINNLLHHINNLKNNFGLNVMVAINKYDFDTQNEIEYLNTKFMEQDILLSIVDGYKLGGLGATDIAEKLVSLTEKENNFKYIYELEDSIKDKIYKVATKIYKAKNVEYSEEALKDIEKIEKLGFDKLPICIAKTQYSLSDDPKNLECTNDYNITVRGIELKNGANFIVVLTGNVMTMPGLSKTPSAENIDIDDDGNITGIF